MRFLETFIALIFGALLLELYMWFGLQQHKLSSREQFVLFLTVGALFVMIQMYLRKKKKKKEK